MSLIKATVADFRGLVMILKPNQGYIWRSSEKTSREAADHVLSVLDNVRQGGGTVLLELQEEGYFSSPGTDLVQVTSVYREDITDDIVCTLVSAAKTLQEPLEDYLDHTLDSKR